MGDRARISINIEELERKAFVATPGPWYVDTVKNEGDYGIGPDDCRTGFMSYSVHNKDGRVLFDSVNRDVGISEIHEEYSEDHVYAWDETAKRDIEYTVTANPSVIIELISLLRDAEKDADRYRWLREIGLAQSNVIGHYAGKEMDMAIDTAMAIQEFNKSASRPHDADETQ